MRRLQLERSARTKSGLGQLLFLRTAIAFSALLAITPSPLAGQATDSSANALRDVVEALPPSARIRVGSLGTRWSGRLAARSPDSISVATESGTHAVGQASIDTLWVRRQKHDGLLAGAGFGALMFALLQIGRESGDREPAARLGAIIFVGATTTGIVIDAVSNRWSQRYPE